MYCCCPSLPGISVSCCFYWNLFGMFSLLLLFLFVLPVSLVVVFWQLIATVPFILFSCTLHSGDERYKKLMIVCPAAGQETGGTINAAESGWHLKTGRTKKKKSMKIVAWHCRFWTVKAFIPFICFSIRGFFQPLSSEWACSAFYSSEFYKHQGIVGCLSWVTKHGATPTTSVHSKKRGLE